MNRGTKIAIYAGLVLIASFLSWGFRANYARLMHDNAPKADTDLVNVKLRDYGKQSRPIQGDYHLGAWGGSLVVSVVLLGLMAAHDVSQYFGGKALKVLYNEDGEGIAQPDYEKAEQEWANGNFLEAIQLMRDYLKENPREQHVALRIAEIYEKDLQNYLAAALEYEEVLKQKLPPERWGWAAIHLCNLYTGKLNQPEKGITLLRRIDTEYTQTAAAEKARKRLTQLEVEGVVSADAENEVQAAGPPAPHLPPGFAPKKI
jgi:hypothetical protein